MTKKEILKNNNEELEYLLKENEFICQELPNLYGFFSKISDDYLYFIYEVLNEEEVSLNYDKMGIENTLSLVRKYLSNLDLNYLNLFDKLLIDGTFELFLKEDDLIKRPEKPIAMGKPNSIIYVPINYDVSDGAIIVHEFFHYLNDLEKYRGIRNIFTEMTSIYFELRFLQFLDEKNIGSNNFNKGVSERLYFTSGSAENLYYVGAIFDVYHNIGKVNKMNIKFIDEWRNIYLESIKDIVEFYHSEDFIEGIDSFRDDVSYLIGTLLSFHALKENKVSDIKMKYINDNMNDMSISDVLVTLETDFDEYLDWIKECVNNLKKAKGELDEKGYSYSRTNSRR